ncbi:hypothetical protein NKT34_08480 [Paenibacillus polysaccharolyticus]|uniref:type II secretion system F family protein n=1 Tax=Paenibacillus polysaccharolyticus TaxID=582692 RepID=UPI00209D38B6|nr:hypothetical protein [Paenibacillus polysaccharolyticus]MCP1133323.1 hypothetical protein [Paenibacillus polysaccharolyticus]
MPLWMSFSYFFVLALITLILLIPKTNQSKSFSLSKVLGYERIRKEAETVGWSLTFREFSFLILISIALIGVIALFTGNYFFIALGTVLCFTVPRTIVLKVKRKIRQNVLFDLPSNLRLFISKLTDFPNVQKALENAVLEMDGVTKPVFEKASNQLRVGLHVDRVFDEMIGEFRIRKMEDFLDKLKLAQMEGFHAQSLDSLKETVEEIGEDITQIQELELEAKSKRRQLFTVIGMSWMMPVMMSMMNNGNANVFLNTLHGQVYIVSFAAATLYAIGKGDDYLSLNLDKI